MFHKNSLRICLYIYTYAVHLASDFQLDVAAQCSFEFNLSLCYIVHVECWPAWFEIS